jgi:hypothetical protein
VIPNATGTTLAITAPGSYKVRVSADNCMTLSNPQVITITDVTNLSPISGINIYPIPAKNSVTIDMKNLADVSALVSVYDLLGRTMTSFTEAGGGTSTLDISSFSPGTYFVKVVQLGEIFNLRFVKQ